MSLHDAYIFLSFQESEMIDRNLKQIKTSWQKLTQLVSNSYETKWYKIINFFLTLGRGGVATSSSVL